MDITKYLIRVNPYKLLLVCIMVSMLFAESIVAVMSIVFRGSVTYDYMATGAIASFFVSLIVVYLLVSFVKTIMASAEEAREAKEESGRFNISLIEAQSIAHVGNWEWDIQEDTAFFSDEIDRILGFRPEKFGGTFKSLMRTVHPDDKELVERKFREALYEHKPFDFEHRIVLPDDTERIIYERGNVITDEEGNPVRMLGTVQDITGRKHIERRLSLQYKVTSLLAESDGIDETMQKILKAVCESNGWIIGEMWVVDKETDSLRLGSIWHKRYSETREFIALSKDITFSRGTGLPGCVLASGKPAWITDVMIYDDFLRKPLASSSGIHAAFAFPVKSKNRVLAVMTFFIQKIKTPDYELLRMFDSIGDQIGGFIERKRMEDVVRQSEKKYREMFDTTSVAVLVEDISEVKTAIEELKSKGVADFRRYFDGNPGFVVDAANKVKITDVNRAAIKLYGAGSREELIGSLSEIFTEGSYSVFKNEMAAMAEGKTYFEAEDINNTLRGERINILLSVSIPQEITESLHRIVSIIDITERRKMEAEREKINRLESVGILAGGIAHDFNNLLTGILGNISFAKMRMASGSKEYSRLTEAENSCMRATELTGRLITFSEGGAPVRRALSIAGIINEIICSELEDTNISCECDIPDKLSHVYGDEGQIKQVFRNMLTNAKEAMPDGGILRVGAEEVTLIEGDIPDIKEGNYIKVSIKDNGRGIPEDILPKIFDPYFTTKGMGSDKGLGLGLAVCHSIIKKHKGHIAVASKPGKGTTFHIYLPAVQTEDNVTGRGDRQSAHSKKRILFMDDEDYVRETSGQMLEYLGYEVEYAKDGAEAVNSYREARESGKPFDAVILDLTVRSGMGGEIAITRLLETDPEARAIVSSGYADNPVLIDFKKYGFSGAIAKPYNVEQLREALGRVMNEG